MAPETVDSLDAENLKPLVLQLLVRIDDLLAQNKTLLSRIAELEAKLGQPPKTPTNSSLPPARGQKANVPAPSREKQGRKGRPGVARALCADPDETREVYADKCVCGAGLEPADQPDVFAYDHIDLPPIRPVTTRVHLHKGFCRCCKRRVAAKPPADMRPGSPFGPGIVALVTYLHACQMVSYARLVEMLDGVLGVQISGGRHRQHAGARLRAAGSPGGRDRRNRALEPRHRQRRDLGARVRQEPLAVDVPRRLGRLSHHPALARKGRAVRLPRTGQAGRVGLRPPRGAGQARQGASVTASPT